MKGHGTAKESGRMGDAVGIIFWGLGDLVDANNTALVAEGV